MGYAKTILLEGNGIFEIGYNQMRKQLFITNNDLQLFINLGINTPPKDALSGIVIPSKATIIFSEKEGDNVKQNFYILNPNTTSVYITINEEF